MNLKDRIIFIDFRSERISEINNLLTDKNYFSNIKFIEDYDFNKEDLNCVLIILHSNNDPSKEIRNKFMGRTNIIIFEGKEISPNLIKNNGYFVYLCSYIDLRDGIEIFLDTFFKDKIFEYKLLINKSHKNKKLHAIRHTFLNSLTALSYSIDNSLKYLGKRDEKTFFNNFINCFEAKKKEFQSGQLNHVIAEFIDSYCAITNKEGTKVKNLERKLKSYYGVIFSDIEGEFSSPLHKKTMISIKQRIRNFADSIGKLVSEADNSLE